MRLSASSNGKSRSLFKSFPTPLIFAKWTSICFHKPEYALHWKTEQAAIVYHSKRYWRKFKHIHFHTDMTNPQKKKPKKPKTKPKQIMRKQTKKGDFTWIIICRSLQNLLLPISGWNRGTVEPLAIAKSAFFWTHGTVRVCSQSPSLYSIVGSPSSKILIPVLPIAVTGAEACWQADAWKAEFTGALNQIAISLKNF